MRTNKKTTNINIRVDKKTYLGIVKIAVSYHLNISQFVRLIIEKELKNYEND